ncbi:hypothetical protein ACCO45_003760 [Purpureocillium lilacinum]|uniref:Uncharacterized protein n=1 Tax=Purpureocillium lilacinum TaxID=33203 RepID=A0ACC4E227_PURLI
MPYMHDWMTGFAGQSQWIALMGVCSNSKTACVLKTAPFDNAADAHLRSRMAELHRLGLPHTFQISCPENQPL